MLGYHGNTTAIRGPNDEYLMCRRQVHCWSNEILIITVTCCASSQKALQTNPKNSQERAARKYNQSCEATSLVNGNNFHSSSLDRKQCMKWLYSQNRELGQGQTRRKRQFFSYQSRTYINLILRLIRCHFGAGALRYPPLALNSHIQLKGDSRFIS